MKLYKYTHANKIIILENASVRFTQPEYLNDPFDMQPFSEALYTQEGWGKFVDDMIVDMLSDEFVNDLKERAWEKVQSRANQEAAPPRNRKERRKRERTEQKARRYLKSSINEISKTEQFRQQGMELLNNTIHLEC